MQSKAERNFRIVALVEATSFLALLVATAIKYSSDQPVGVQILGPIHGVLFIAYVVLAVNLARQAEWPTKTTLFVLLGAVVPFGGYVVDRWLARRPTQPA